MHHRHSLKRTSSFLLVIILAIGLVLALLAVRISQEIRQRASTSTGTAKYTLVSNQNGSALEPGSKASISVTAIDLGASPISGFQFVASFNSTTIPTDLTFEPAFIMGLKTYSNAWFDTPNGKVLRFLAVVDNPSNPMVFSSAVIGKITFTVPANGSVVIDPSASTEGITSKITAGADVDILAIPSPVTFTFGSSPTSIPTPLPTTTVTPSPSPLPTPIISSLPTPTPTPSSNSHMIQYIQFLGVNTDKGPIKANVKIGLMGTSTPFFDRNVALTYMGYVPNSNIPASYMIEFENQPEIVPQSMYWISIKGEKHAQRVYLNNQPTAGASLSFGLDPSKVNEPGDLPSQDGIINDNDIGKVIAILAKPTKVLEDLTMADVNYDGAVNSADLSLILSVLSSKSDENL